MWMGGPKPGGSVTSKTDTTPHVVPASASTRSSNSPRSIKRPSPGATTKHPPAFVIPGRLSCASRGGNSVGPPANAFDPLPCHEREERVDSCAIARSGAGSGVSRVAALRRDVHCRATLVRPVRVRRSLRLERAQARQPRRRPIRSEEMEVQVFGDDLPDRRAVPAIVSAMIAASSPTPIRSDDCRLRR